MGNSCCAEDASQNNPIEKVGSPRDLSAVMAEEQEELALKITVVGARRIRNSDWLPGTGGKPDCYCEVKCDAEKLYTTQVITDSLEPVWSEEFSVTNIKEGMPLEFSVYDKDLIGSDFLGTARLEAKDYADKGFNGELKLASDFVDEATIKVQVKVAGEDLPPAPPPQYVVTIQKNSKEESFGVRFDIRDKIHCQVLEMVAGAFSSYNDTASPVDQVKVHDYIVSVNGVRDSSEAMLEEFKNSMEVKCEIKRSVYTTVLYDRGEANTPLGLQFSAHATSDYLVITGVDEKHNKNAKEHEKLFPGDRIISIGSIRCKPAELHDKLKKQSGKVQLNVLRPAAGHNSERPAHWSFF